MEIVHLKASLPVSLPNGLICDACTVNLSNFEVEALMVEKEVHLH